MRVFSIMTLIFIIGGSLGWVLELVYRRLAHKKWINPGFLAGPCLPLYGTGLLLLYGICSLDVSVWIPSPVWQKVAVVILITVTMTLIEYLTGLIFIKAMKVQLWDYSTRWGNIGGIICPLFTFFWGVIGAVYYFFVHPSMVRVVEIFAAHPFYAYWVGMYFGVFVLDNIYSFRVVSKIRAWAKEQRLVVRYENFKLAIHNRAEEQRQKRSFVFSFRSRNGLDEELEHFRPLHRLVGRVKKEKGTVKNQTTSADHK